MPHGKGKQIEKGRFPVEDYLERAAGDVLHKIDMGKTDDDDVRNAKGRIH